MKIWGQRMFYFQKWWAFHLGGARDIKKENTKTFSGEKRILFKGYKIAIMWMSSINTVWLTALKCAQTHKPGCFQLVHREREHSGKEKELFSVGSSRKVAKSCLMALFTLHHGAERQGDSQARMETSHTISQSVAMSRPRRFWGKYLTVCLKQMLFFIKQI